MIRKKNQPGCPCCGSGCGGSPGTLNVNVKGCGSLNYPGVTVNATLGATTVSGSTDASGNVSLSIPSPGSWTVTAVAPTSRFNNASTSATVTCGGTSTANLTLPPKTGYHCCPGTLNAMPDVLYGTDANGSHTLTLVPGDSCRWYYLSGAANGAGTISVVNVYVYWSGTQWGSSFEMNVGGFGHNCFTPGPTLSTSNDPISFTVNESDYSPSCGTEPSVWGFSVFPLTVTE